MYLRVFVIGGILCALFQFVIDKTAISPGRLHVSMVVLGCILGGLGIYPRFIEFAGGGASVPLPGFGSLMALGAKEAVDNIGFLGIFTGGLTAGAGGIAAAMLFGLLTALIFEPNDK